MIDDITFFFFPNIKNIKIKYNSIVNFSKLIFNKKILILSGAVARLYPFFSQICYTNLYRNQEIQSQQ